MISKEIDDPPKCMIKDKEMLSMDRDSLEHTD